ncbi:MAG: hypothetical protein MZV70_72530 [Desulfobacterales bacterium]|nr:hypothetical protein [Desulfobacterales bacterium]
MIMASGRPGMHLEILIPVGNVSHSDHGLPRFLRSLDVGEDGDIQDDKFFHPIGNEKSQFLGHNAAPVMADQEEFIDPEGVDDLDHIFGQFYFLIGFDIQGAFALAKTAQIGSNDTQLRIKKSSDPFPAVRAFRPSVQHNDGVSILVPPVTDVEGSPRYVDFTCFHGHNISPQSAVQK